MPVIVLRGVFHCVRTFSFIALLSLLPRHILQWLRSNSVSRKTIRYEIYLLQLGLHPVEVVVRLVQKLERDSTKGETIHKIYKNVEYTK